MSRKQPDPAHAGLPEGWLARNADLIYRLVLVALIGLWVVFPPQLSRPEAHRPAGPALAAKATP